MIKMQWCLYNIVILLFSYGPCLFSFTVPDIWHNHFVLIWKWNGKYCLEQSEHYFCSVKVKGTAANPTYRVWMEGSTEGTMQRLELWCGVVCVCVCVCVHMCVHIPGMCVCVYVYMCSLFLSLMYSL